MTEEAEKQDFRLELAQQVAHRRTQQQDVALAVIQLSVSAHVCLLHLQVFLLRTPDVAAADKPKLQQQILATIFSNGELAVRSCCCMSSQ
jgi:hypothetical protein